MRIVADAWGQGHQVVHALVSRATREVVVYDYVSDHYTAAHYLTPKDCAKVQAHACCGCAKDLADTGANGRRVLLGKRCPTCTKNRCQRCAGAWCS